MTLGLNLECPLLLSTVIEHAATTFGDTLIVSRNREETARGNYRTAAMRCRRLASSLLRLGLEDGVFVGSLAWNTHRHFELFYGVSGVGGDSAHRQSTPAAGADTLTRSISPVIARCSSTPTRSHWPSSSHPAWRPWTATS